VSRSELGLTERYRPVIDPVDNDLAGLRVRPD